MDKPQNRMATASTRTPHPAAPVERVPVQPPPEMVIKCRHCGAAKIKGWRVLGGRPGGGHTKQCSTCGLVYDMSADGKTMRLIR